MPHTEIVRVDATYPAPPASKDLEPGPLTIDAWVCPDRATAIALFWLAEAASEVWIRHPLRLSRDPSSLSERTRSAPRRETTIRAKSLPGTTPR